MTYTPFTYDVVCGLRFDPMLMSWSANTCQLLSVIIIAQDCLHGCRVPDTRDHIVGIVSKHPTCLSFFSETGIMEGLDRNRRQQG